MAQTPIFNAHQSHTLTLANVPLTGFETLKTQIGASCVLSVKGFYYNPGLVGRSLHYVTNQVDPYATHTGSRSYSSCAAIESACFSNACTALLPASRTDCIINLDAPAEPRASQTQLPLTGGSF
jgi:hypothetical protein